MKIFSCIKTIMRIISPVLTTHYKFRHPPKNDTSHTSIMIYNLKIIKYNVDDKMCLTSMFILVNLCFFIDFICWIFSSKKSRYETELVDGSRLTNFLQGDTQIKVGDLSVRNVGVKSEFLDELKSKIKSRKSFNEDLSTQSSLVKTVDTEKVMKDNSLEEKEYQKDTQCVLYRPRHIEIFSINKVCKQNGITDEETLNLNQEEKLDFYENRKKIEKFFLNKVKKNDFASYKDELKTIDRKFDFNKLMNHWNQKQKN